MNGCTLRLSRETFLTIFSRLEREFSACALPRSPRCGSALIPNQTVGGRFEVVY